MHDKVLEQGINIKLWWKCEKKCHQHKMLQPVLEREQWVEHRILCGFTDFKREGKTLQMMKEPAIQQFQEQIQMYKKLLKWQEMNTNLLENNRRTTYE